MILQLISRRKELMLSKECHTYLDSTKETVASAACSTTFTHTGKLKNILPDLCCYLPGSLFRLVRALPE